MSNGIDDGYSDGVTPFTSNNNTKTINAECWTCKFWEASYEVKVKGEIEVIRGKCPNRKGIVNDQDYVCDEYIKFEGRK